MTRFNITGLLFTRWCFQSWSGHGGTPYPLAFCLLPCLQWHLHRGNEVCFGICRMTGNSAGIQGWKEIPGRRNNMCRGMKASGSVEGSGHWGQLCAAGAESGRQSGRAYLDWKTQISWWGENVQKHFCPPHPTPTKSTQKALYHNRTGHFCLWQQGCSCLNRIILGNALALGNRYRIMEEHDRLLSDR